MELLTADAWARHSHQESGVSLHLPFRGFWPGSHAIILNSAVKSAIFRLTTWKLTEGVVVVKLVNK